MKFLYVEVEQSAITSFKDIYATEGISVESCQDAHYVTKHTARETFEND